MTKSRRIIFIFYGILLGVCMGVLSSSSSLILWFHFERPDFLIRAGWVEISISFLIISGAVVGSFFGTQLCSMKNHPNTHMKWLLSNVLIIIGASSVYFGFDYLAIKWRNITLHLVSHPLVFCWCLAVIYFLGGNLKCRATNS
jgi:hypothetical protein